MSNIETEFDKIFVMIKDIMNRIEALEKSNSCQLDLCDKRFKTIEKEILFYHELANITLLKKKGGVE
jgi:hypothetical protein